MSFDTTPCPLAGRRGSGWHRTHIRVVGPDDSDCSWPIHFDLIAQMLERWLDSDRPPPLRLLALKDGLDHRAARMGRSFIGTSGLPFYAPQTVCGLFADLVVNGRKSTMYRLA